MMMVTRRDRVKKLALASGIDKEVFMRKTPYSADQWQSWFGGGKNNVRSPSAEQMQVIFEAFNWSPLYVFFGRGPTHVSDLLDLIDAAEAYESDGVAKTHHRAVSEQNREMLKEILGMLKEAE